MFRVNPQLDFEVRTLPDDGGRYLICDNFYADADAVRQLILSTPYPMWANTPAQSRNFVDYHDCRHSLLIPSFEPQSAVAQLARDYLQIEIQQGRHHFSTNVWKLLTEQPPNSQPFPHDDGLNCAALVMLNTPEECSGGTAFYRCKKPRLCAMPLETRRREQLIEQVYSGARSHNGQCYFLERWERYWQCLDIVEMRFNRLLIYPGVLFHGHWQEPNTFRDCWRVNQLMFFDQVAFHPYYHQLCRSW